MKTRAIFAAAVGLTACARGATVTVLATKNLTDWSHTAEYPVDPGTGFCIPNLDPVPAQMFFKYSLQ